MMSVQSYVVLLRGEALEPPAQQVVQDPRRQPLHTSPHKALTTSSFKGFYEREKKSEHVTHHIGVSSVTGIGGESEEDGGVSGQDSVLQQQQQWVRHWIDREMHRDGSGSGSVSRSEQRLRLQSNPSTGEKKYHYSASFEQWSQEVPAAAPKKVTADAVVVSPHTVYVDKRSGEAEAQAEEVSSRGSVVTLRNTTSSPREVLVEASSSVAIQLAPRSEQSQSKHFEIPPNSSLW